MTYKKVILKKNEDRRIKSGHLWIFSNEIDTSQTPLTQFQPGEIVFIEQYNNGTSKPNRLGIGYINPNSLIAVRLLTKNTSKIIDKTFFIKKIEAALAYRKTFYSNSFYRLLFSEGDFLPGLIIDRYNDIFVIQINTAGIAKFKKQIVEAIIEIFNPSGILIQYDSHNQEIERLPNESEIIYGNIPETVLLEENQTQFQVPMISGQKTGWFFDHTINRSLLCNLAKDKRVLDIFSYIGGWGVQAAKHGATEVFCVDSSKPAIKNLEHNAELNNVSDKIETFPIDAFDALKQLANEKFDIVICDPPAFIKRRKDFQEGFNAYLRINELALNLLSPNGLLFSASCSMLMGKDDLHNAIRKASQSSKKPISFSHNITQSPDHPIHPMIPETEYLKGFVVSLR